MEFKEGRAELRISSGLFGNLVDRLRKETDGTLTNDEINNLRDEFNIEKFPFGDFYLEFCQSGGHYLCAVFYKHPEQQQNDKRLRELANNLKEFEFF